jgi:hypothetical protein
VPRSRATVPCLPAGCFACRRLGSYHQPADRRWARRQQHRGVQDAHNLAWKLWQRCSTARLVPRFTRYTYHTMNGTRSDCSHYMQQQAFVRFGFCMGQGAEVPHSSTMGGIDDGLCRYTAHRRPYSARRRTSRRCSPKEELAGEPGITGLRT